MTDPNYSALLIVLDRSGSMASIRQPMIDAVTEIVREHGKQAGLTTVDLWMFDEIVEHAIALGDPSTTTIELHPRGGTALFDAVGEAVISFKNVIDRWPEHARPSSIQVVVISDGHENSSIHFTSGQVRALVSARRDDNWDFLFVGVEERALLEAGEMGFREGRSVRFEASERSTRQMGQEVSRRIRRRTDEEVEPIVPAPSPTGPTGS